MRLFLNITACLLLGLMLADPMLAPKSMAMAAGSDLSLVALGLAGVMLGRQGGYRPEDTPAR